MKTIKIIFFCKILQFHNWTCNANKGIKPTQEQINGGYNGFKDYAKMYCDCCGKESKLNNLL